MVTLEGKAIKIAGALPARGEKAPDFTLTDGSLEDVSLKDYKGKRVVLNIFPSLDTDVCASSVKQFEKRVLELENVQILSISKDLPFAQQRFCINENIEKVKILSGFRNSDFGKEYGVEIMDGPIKGLYSRAVVVMDEEGTVLYREQVPEISQEPQYQAALDSLKA